MRMRSSTMWLGIFGGLMMVLLMGRNIKGSIMIGILFVTFVSWIQGHGGSFLGAGSQIPGETLHLPHKRPTSFNVLIHLCRPATAVRLLSLFA